MKQLIIILSIILTSGNTFAQSTIKVGERAPEIHITNWIKNVPADQELNNKYIVLEFWATWCGPCIAAVPHMNKLQQEFHPKDLYYLSMTDESAAQIERTLKRIHFSSIVVTDTTTQTQINFGDGVKGLEAFPLTVLINKNGIIEWIGEPQKLDAKMMSKFLSNSLTANSKPGIDEHHTQQGVQEALSFKDLLQKKDMKNYFQWKETSSQQPSKIAIGTMIIALNAYSLENIYNDIFKITNKQLKLPENLKNKRYDILYKNTENPQNTGVLENDLLNALHLIKHTETKLIRENIVSISDSSLLEKTLEKTVSHESEAGDKIIFTRSTISEVVNKLSNNSSGQSYVFNGKDKTKYDFIIGTKSKDEIIKSLKSYGLLVKEKDVKVNYTILTEKK
ncbi:MAG: TlpA family protein disulfide reductase [Bacteroidales bacterium]|nr:TlpA family protein disulfide reductase [Bacteroidales bacterium]